MCSLEPQFVAMTVSQENPKAMWDNISQADKSKCEPAVHTIRNRLLKKKMFGGETLH